jgi:hypothetical protein
MESGNMATVNEKMTALADEIRELSGTTTSKSIDTMTTDVNTANLAINDQTDLITQIRNIANNLPEAGGGATEINLQDKTVTPTTSQQTVTADNGYDGLDTVTVNAIPSSYIQPSGTKTVTTNGTHDVKTYASVSVNVAGEDVTAETNAYTTKLASLETAVSALEAELAGKASGGGGGTAETCTITIMAEAPVNNSTFYYADVSGTMCTQTVSGMDMMMGGTTITCMKNSFIYAYMTFDNVSGATFQNITRIDNNCIFVSGDATYTIG